MSGSSPQSVVWNGDRRKGRVSLPACQWLEGHQINVGKKRLSEVLAQLFMKLLHYL